MPIYAIHLPKQHRGVYSRWSDVKHRVQGVAAVYRKCESKEEAKEFSEFGKKKKKKTTGSVIDVELCGVVCNEYAGYVIRPRGEDQGPTNIKFFVRPTICVTMTAFSGRHDKCTCPVRCFEQIDWKQYKNLSQMCKMGMQDLLSLPLSIDTIYINHEGMVTWLNANSKVIKSRGITLAYDGDLKWVKQCRQLVLDKYLADTWNSYLKTFRCDSCTSGSGHKDECTCPFYPPVTVATDADGNIIKYKNLGLLGVFYPFEKE